MVTDGRGQIILPFLANYYEQIYVVDIQENGWFSAVINDIVATYNIKDVIITQRVSRLGDCSYSLALNDFVS